MWTEEKIRAVLNKKEQVLAETKEKYEANREWLFAGEFMKEPNLINGVACELAAQREDVKKLENQVEVLKCILDN